MSDTFEQAKTFFLQGLHHYQQGRFEQAQTQFEASLALLPGRPSTLANLGACRVQLGRHDEAVALLDEALAQEPGDAGAWGHRATALAELGRLEQALDSVDRSLALEPRSGRGWGLRGNLLKDLGRPDEAIAAFEQAVALGHEVDLHRYFLAGLRGQAAAPAPPRAYVELLFDGYADGFDQHLVRRLGYRAPEVLAQPLRAAGGGAVDSALDLGCGTGLCAPLLRPLARRLTGVDLSAGMLARARTLGLYDELVQADLAEHLQATGARHDLVVAADVFVYVGALGAVFAGAARVLRPGGVFAFSVEEATGGAELELRPSLRYAHAEGGLRRLAATHGFEVMRALRQPIRHEQGHPIAGLYLWLTKG
ncbi:tetratricopeptide repeat protein [Ramlibacter tataouinensis]|uniref:Methyltransferase type 11 domain-containing protein n=1 Tax=Ramlibacter tataouinensis (strain ATCC BAA-407 / DSM 14655 / LMG 21543 / TTB310) TaxID=365046 RepID=F5XVK1_RAMTT|nr:tetratricopeptide repeat protein [Ramlibacter tataouinensis]AEG91577.1 Conserved hypothetical protein [Ramlibacter tataouinensis TTB310]